MPQEFQGGLREDLGRDPWGMGQDASTAQSDVFQELSGSKYDLARAKSYLALDVSTWEAAERYVTLFDNVVDGYKVGLQLFDADGFRVLEELNRRNKRVFLDVKLHDIPNTVAGALRSLSQFDLEMVNVHAMGGRKMLEQARQAVGQGSKSKRPLLIAVTILTSLGDADLEEMGFSMAAEPLVLKLATLAAQCDLDGVVASAAELRAIRQQLAEPFEVVVPGTRLPGGNLHDQVRTLSPGEALKLGASRIVIGRAVTSAEDPLQALKRVWDNMNGLGE